MQKKLRGSHDTDNIEGIDMQDANQPFNPYKLFVGSFIPNALLRYTHLSSSAKLVWARLAQYAGEKGIAFPKINTLAKEIGLSESQVQRLLKELETKRFIRRFKPTGAQRLKHLPDSYVFLFHPCFTSHLCDSGPSTDATSGPTIDDTSGPRADATSNRRESALRESEGRESRTGETSSPAAPEMFSSGAQGNSKGTLEEKHGTADQPDGAKSSFSSITTCTSLDTLAAPTVPPYRPPYLPKLFPLDHPVCQVISRFADHWAAMTRQVLDVSQARAAKEVSERLTTTPLPDLLALVDLWFDPGLSWVTQAERGAFHRFIQPRAISELKGIHAGLTTTNTSSGYIKPATHDQWKNVPSGERTFTRRRRLPSHAHPTPTNTRIP